MELGGSNGFSTWWQAGAGGKVGERMMHKLHLYNVTKISNMQDVMSLYQWQIKSNRESQVY